MKMLGYPAPLITWLSSVSVLLKYDNYHMTKED